MKFLKKNKDLQPFWHQWVEDGVDGGVEIVEHTCYEMSNIFVIKCHIYLRGGKSFKPTFTPIEVWNQIQGVQKS